MSKGDCDRIDFDAVHTYQGLPFERRLPIRPTIINHLIYRSLHSPRNPFLSVPTEDECISTISYGEFEAATRRLARWIRRDLGARDGEVLALLPANDIRSVLAIFAAMRAACALLLLNPVDPLARIEEQIAAIGIGNILKSPALPAELSLSAHAIPDPALLDDAPREDLQLDPSAEALIFGTSGSTAASKLVAQSHYSAAVNAEAVKRHHELAPGDRILGCLPIHHVNSVHFTLFATVASGAHAILAPRFDALRYHRLVEQYRPRIAGVVPSILEALVETWRRPVFPSEFEYFVSAAAPLSVATARRVAYRLGPRVLQGYGLTETMNFSTTMPRSLTDEEYKHLTLDADIPSIGQALFGNEVAVLRSDSTPAAAGEVGEICMRGHNMMARYIGNTKSTSEAFRDGWFHSQDLGFSIEGTRQMLPFFVITGRTKNIAKVGGETVSLDEMERVLRLIPDVQDAACVVVPHRFLGDQIVVAVVSAQEIGEDAVLPALRAAFAPNALPRRVVKLETIPRTPTGKLQRAALAEQLAESVREAEAQRNEPRRQLIEKSCEVR